MINKLIKYMDENYHKCHVLERSKIQSRPELGYWCNGSRVIIVNDEFLVHTVQSFKSFTSVFHKQSEIGLSGHEQRKIFKAFARCQKALAEMDLK